MRTASIFCLFACLLLSLVAVGCGPTELGGDDPNPAPVGDDDDAADDDDDDATDDDDSPTDANGMSITKSDFGETPDGQAIDLYTCTNSNGLVVKLATYGATVVSVETPDRDGKLANITLGFDSLEGYLGKHPYFGATIGRYCNRIAGGKFTLDGEEYTLAQNNGENALHGGEKGFNRVVWTAKEVKNEAGVGVEFSYSSPDGEEGYPGKLDVTVLYKLTENDELLVDFTATTDKATPVNLTNHNYWNLGGAGSGKILDHVLMIDADRYLPVNDGLIPTGELAPVEGTPMDFTEPKTIGSRFEQMAGDPGGYDHCYALKGEAGKMTLAARVADRDSGRVMEIFTTQPGLQFYTGNFLAGEEAQGGNEKNSAFCLETQHYPDSPNQPDFPSAILKPGETYRQTTTHRFSVE